MKVILFVLLILTISELWLNSKVLWYQTFSDEKYAEMITRMYYSVIDTRSNEPYLYHGYVIVTTIASTFMYTYPFYLSDYSWPLGLLMVISLIRMTFTTVKSMGRPMLSELLTRKNTFTKWLFFSLSVLHHVVIIGLVVNILNK